MAVSNDDRRYQRRFPSLIRPNTRYVVIFKVRKGSIHATINGTPVVNMKTDYRDLKVSSWHQINKWQNLAFFVDDPAIIYQIEVTEVTGEGSLTRFPSE